MQSWIDNLFHKAMGRAAPAPAIRVRVQNQVLQLTITEAEELIELLQRHLEDAKANPDQTYILPGLQTLRGRQMAGLYNNLKRALTA